MKLYALTATWGDGVHELSNVVSMHATREDAEQALRTIHSGADAADLVTYSVEEVEAQA